MADINWRYYTGEHLAFSSPVFRECVEEVLLTLSVSAAELDRRKRSFLELWQYIIPLVEQELGMLYEEFAWLV